MTRRVDIAARVRENCNNGLGENCACAKKIANDEVDLEEAESFLLSLLANNNRHTVVIEDGLTLMVLLGHGLIFDMTEGSDLYDPFDPERGIDLHLGHGYSVLSEAEVIADPRPDFLGEVYPQDMGTYPSLQGILDGFMKKGRHHFGNGAEIRGFDRHRSGKITKGGPRRAKGGN